MPKKPKLEDVEKKIKEAVKSGSVRFAPQDVVYNHHALLEIILGILGSPNAWVSDMSSATDFFEFGPEEENFNDERDDFIRKCKHSLNVDLTTMYHQPFSILLPYIIKQRGI